MPVAALVFYPPHACSLLYSSSLLFVTVSSIRKNYWEEIPGCYVYLTIDTTLKYRQLLTRDTEEAR